MPYVENADNFDFFLSHLVESLPPNYRPPELRDFYERVLTPSAEDLNAVNFTFDQLYIFIDPATAPEEWVDWMLVEWLGWTLIPEGYPVARKRRVLGDLFGMPGYPYKHFKRRYTVRGMRELLREFGIVAQVLDERPYIGGFYGTYGSVLPLNVRVRILGYEPFFTPQHTTVGGFWGGGGLIGHTTQQIITESFVMQLIRWSRPAGVRVMAEWRTSSFKLSNTIPIADDDEISFA